MKKCLHNVSKSTYKIQYKLLRNCFPFRLTSASLFFHQPAIKKTFHDPINSQWFLVHYIYGSNQQTFDYQPWALASTSDYRLNNLCCTEHLLVLFFRFIMGEINTAAGLWKVREFLLQMRELDSSVWMCRVCAVFFGGFERPGRGSDGWSIRTQQETEYWITK